MLPTIYTRQRGETILIAIADDGAVAGDETTLSANLRALLPGKSALARDQAIAATAQIFFRPADAIFPVGWTLMIDAATCLGLAVGRYLIDLKIPLGGGAYKTISSARIVITEPATL